MHTEDPLVGREACGLFAGRCRSQYPPPSLNRFEPRCLSYLWVSSSTLGYTISELTAKRSTRTAIACVVKNGDGSKDRRSAP